MGLAPEPAFRNSAALRMTCQAANTQTSTDVSAYGQALALSSTCDAARYGRKSRRHLALYHLRVFEGVAVSGACATTQSSGEIVQHRARSHNVSAPVHPINIARTLHGYGQFISSCRSTASLCCVLPCGRTRPGTGAHQVETSTRPTAVFG
jgi:hypothetical protein